jgi:hypothetical protein
MRHLGAIKAQGVEIDEPFELFQPDIGDRAGIEADRLQSGAVSLLRQFQ